MIDVLILTYNHEKYIAQCIESVLTQDLSIVNKIIILDDCSSDATSSICQSYTGNKRNKIDYFRNTCNLGIEENFYQGLLKISAKYFLIIDGDDYFISQDKLKIQYNILEEKTHLIGVAHQIQEVDYQGNLIKNHSEIEKVHELNWKTIGKNRPFHTNSFLVHTTVIPELKELKLFYYCNDIALICTALEKGEILLLPDKYSAYRRHTESNSIKDSQFKYFEVVKSLYHYLIKKNQFYYQYLQGIKLINYQKRTYLASNGRYPYSGFFSAISEIFSDLIFLRNIKKAIYPLYLYIVKRYVSKK